jgi:hypothetical protein
MPALLRGAFAAVWIALIAATLLSWWLGTDHGVHDVGTASALILTVAFVKVRFVGLYFMELRDAPIALRGIFEGWCVAVCSAVIVLYVTT